MPWTEFGNKSGPTGPIVIKAIEPGSLGSKEPSLRIGLVLVELQGRAVVGRPFRRVLSVGPRPHTYSSTPHLRHAERVLTLAAC